MTLPSGYSPGRPPTERDLVQTVNGMPKFLGQLVSTGAVAVNNATTATPFNFSLAVSGKFDGTLAGKVLILQGTANGLILPSDSAAITIVQQSVTPSLVAPLAYPGILIGANERVVLTMGMGVPFLQFVAVAGNATLNVWELV